MKLTSFTFIACLFMLFSSCKKYLPVNVINSQVNNAVGLSDTNGPINKPLIDYKNTTPTQYMVATGNSSAKITIKLSAKRTGIKIISFTFLAYEQNLGDVRLIQMDGKDELISFKETSLYLPAKASAEIKKAGILLPHGDTSLSVSFTVYYCNNFFAAVPKSGDTVALQLASVNYMEEGKTGYKTQSFSSVKFPVMMVIQSKPSIFLSAVNDSLHAGEAKIFNVDYSTRSFVSIDNLPLIINCKGVQIENNLTVKDVFNNIVNTTTLKQNNHFTITFKSPIALGDDPDGMVLSVFAQVKNVQNQGSLTTSLQQPAHFSWADATGRKFTIENKTYFVDYPETEITVHN